MKEMIRNWLALPDLLWKSFVFLLDLFWKDHKLTGLPKALFSMFIYVIKHIWNKCNRSTEHSCVGCKYFIKQSPHLINWNNVLKTDNVLLEDMPKRIDRDSCLLNHPITLDSACSRWNDGSFSSSTEEERILDHHW